MAERRTPGPVIGVDLGGTKLYAAVVGADGKIVARARKKTRAERGHEEVISRLIDCVKEVLQDAHLRAAEVPALCVGAPGPLDPENGIVISAPNLNWVNVPLKQILEDALGIRTFLDNDVNVGTYGEFKAGAGQGACNLVGIFIGTGIGGGLILDRNLYRGSNNTAGEIGHLVIQRGGPLCTCGNRGCLEAIAGRGGIVREIAFRTGRGAKTSLLERCANNLAEVRSKLLADAFAEQDPLVVQLVRDAIEAVGIAVGSLVNVLSPDTVVIGGGMVEAFGSWYVGAVAEVARQNAFPQCMANVRIVPAALGDDAGVLGAAFLAHEAITGRK